MPGVASVRGQRRASPAVGGHLPGRTGGSGLPPSFNSAKLHGDLYPLTRASEKQGIASQTRSSKLLKIGARIRETCRRIWLHPASGYPYRDLLPALLQNLRASPG
jgi:hypothetical protein